MVLGGDFQPWTLHEVGVCVHSRIVFSKYKGLFYFFVKIYRGLIGLRTRKRRMAVPFAVPADLY